MTTKATKKAQDDAAIEAATQQRLAQSAELEALRAKLAAVQAERDELAVKVASKSSGKDPRKAEWMREPKGEEFTAAADTPLGKVQRMKRDELCYIIQKVFRQIPNPQLPKLLDDLLVKATESGGVTGDLTVEKILAEAQTVKPRKKKEGAENV